MWDDSEARKLALEIASKAVSPYASGMMSSTPSGGTPPAGEIVTRAETYLAFLKGEENNG